ncbi:metallophosphoesterase family protein (plasmid) [Aneurinibacillus sp. Ricciae_BoGa-3]|uniref:metallophosphoesterase family protein n=1 Tax=Aneurinibacillus sp. Ricciae_BoGa-3 TaxID=3022697 RepID=UPI0023427A78|nr:metallophosphoesterase family protein [Aneurinibacillus sp. Ricciae_BoGa-3]WCK57177.1 metallophosphoesterase family protein [Aneurinibacillus sp. Ricciae_BoGa-3]
MERLFVIGDIHGKRHTLELMLSKWNPDKERLVLLGDLIDRGEDSYGVIQLAQRLREEYGAIVLRGNHEGMLLDWMENPYEQLEAYYPQGGRETLYSFFDTDITYTRLPSEIVKQLKTYFTEEIQFLKSLPYYYEWNQYLLVHAGVNLNLKDWKNSNQLDFTWIRKPFHYGKNETGKIIIFGHTLTKNLNSDNSKGIWVSPCQSKIGIDGGAVFGGYLHGIVLDKEGIQQTYSVGADNQIYTGTLDLAG